MWSQHRKTACWLGMMDLEVQWIRRTFGLQKGKLGRMTKDLAKVKNIREGMRRYLCAKGFVCIFKGRTTSYFSVQWPNALFNIYTLRDSTGRSCCGRRTRCQLCAWLCISGPLSDGGSNICSGSFSHVQIHVFVYTWLLKPLVCNCLESVGLGALMANRSFPLLNSGSACFFNQLCAIQGNLLT